MPRPLRARSLPHRVEAPRVAKRNADFALLAALRAPQPGTPDAMNAGQPPAPGLSIEKETYMSFQHHLEIQPLAHAPQPSRLAPSQHERKRLVPWQWKETVLVIEDEPEMRSLLTWALRREGYHVFAFANGDDVLTWLGPGVLDGDLERVPSAIVCDIWIPYFSGLEILESLRLAGERIPMIMITGFPDESTRQQAMQLGASCMLEKPFALDVLCAAVHRAIARSDRVD